MQLVLISDTHGQHRSLDLPPGDVLIHSGDLTLAGERSVALDFVSWLAEQPHKHKIFIAGNHDRWVEQNTDELFDISRQLGVHYLQESSVEIDGVHFWGSPYTPEFMNWSFMLPCTVSAMTYWQRMPDNVDVLITHGPPAGILDTLHVVHNNVVKDAGADSHCKPAQRGVGCPALAKRVESVAPKYHVFGHIHEAYGRQQIGSTQFVNASCMNRDYLLANPAQVVSLDTHITSPVLNNTYVFDKTQSTAVSAAKTYNSPSTASDFEDDLARPALSDIAS